MDIIEREKMIEYLVDFESARMTLEDTKIMLRTEYDPFEDSQILAMYTGAKKLEDQITSNEPTELLAS